MPILIGGLGTVIGCLQNYILYIQTIWLQCVLYGVILYTVTDSATGSLWDMTGVKPVTSALVVGFNIPKSCVSVACDQNGMLKDHHC